MQLTDPQRALIDQYASNAWFVYELIDAYQTDPSAIPDTWRTLFQTAGIPTQGTTIAVSESSQTTKIPVITLFPEDEPEAIQGGAARIAENMNASLSVPVATSLRVIPVKLL